MTFRLWNVESINLLPKSQPSHDLKFGPNIAGNVLIEEEEEQLPFDVDLTLESSSLGASHREVKPFLTIRLIVENARSIVKINTSLHKSEALTGSLNTIQIQETHF